MDLTVIYRGASIEQILMGSPTEEIIQWVEDANKNPLITDKYSYKKEYSRKGVYELAEFLGINTNQ